jgi:hypothetical protein
MPGHEDGDAASVAGWAAFVAVVVLGIAVAGLWLAISNAQRIDTSSSSDQAMQIDALVDTQIAQGDFMLDEAVQQQIMQGELDALEGRRVGSGKANKLEGRRVGSGKANKLAALPQDASSIEQELAAPIGEGGMSHQEVIAQTAGSIMQPAGPRRTVQEDQDRADIDKARAVLAFVAPGEAEQYLTLVA